jgi:hypothetical protein
MSHMFLESIRENEDIIKVDHAEDVEEIAETIVSVSLERCGGVGETKGHNEVFEVAIAGTKGGFVFIAFCNPKLVVCICHIEACEVLGVLETIEKLRDEREGISILDGDIVELAIINTKAEGAIRLFDKENRGAERRLRRTNESFGNHVVDIVLQSLEFRFGEVVDGAVDGFGIGHEGNLVVHTRAMRRKFLRILGFEDVGEFGIFGRE